MINSYRGNVNARKPGTPPFITMDSNENAGEEYDFVENPGREYFCPVTYELLKEPRQTSLCCGNHLSRAAVERLEAEGKPCPICNKGPLKTTEDLFFKRKVMGLKVRCNNKAMGCKWVGELWDLSGHLNSGSVDGKCDFVAVDCPLKCGKHIQRSNLAQHKTTKCPKRQCVCQYCGYQSTHDKIFNDHLSKCQGYPLACPNNCSTMQRQFIQRHIREECPLQKIECEFSHAGCNVKVARQSMQKHLEECKDVHLKMTSAKCKKLEAEMNNLKFAIFKISPKPIFIPPPAMNLYSFGYLKMLIKFGTVLLSTLMLVATRCALMFMPMELELGKVLMLVYLST